MKPQREHCKIIRLLEAQAGIFDVLKSDYNRYYFMIMLMKLKIDITYMNIRVDPPEIENFFFLSFQC